MGLHLKKSDTLILLVPKAGSRWIAAAPLAAEVDFDNVGPPELRGHTGLRILGREYAQIACASLGIQLPRMYEASPRGACELAHSVDREA